MKKKSLLGGIAFLLIFLIAFYVLSNTGKITYYEPKAYKDAFNDSIYGVVTRTVEGKNFFGIVVGNDTARIYRFTYDVETTPKEWQTNYPKQFILPGDSIIKSKQNDTFTVVRNQNRWTYLLPDDGKAK